MDKNWRLLLSLQSSSAPPPQISDFKVYVSVDISTPNASCYIPKCPADSRATDSKLDIERETSTL